MKSWLAAAWIGLALLGCSGAGRFGYARTYVPLGEEDRYLRLAEESVYDEVRRMPDRFRNKLISWFGVVTDVQPAASGEARVAMQVRTHQERHLCEEPEEHSCRVTVSEQSGGPFTAVLRLSPDDRAGENRLQPGSLVRVYGDVVVGEYDAQGGPVLRARHYRHWPRGQYVTTALRGSWRQ